MTANEKALLEIALAGTHATDYTARFNEARMAVLLERLPEEKKVAWQDVYRRLRAVRLDLDQATVDLGLQDTNLIPWKKEVEDEVP